MATGDAAATPEAWAARLAELADAHPDAVGRRRGASSAERGEGADSELVTWAEAARLAVSSHVRDLALLQSLPRGDDLPDDRRAGRSAGSAEPGDGSRGRGDARPTPRRRSPTRPSSSSRRWTSASCSTRPASCSRSGTGSATATLDPSYYDLLASEARLASFLAIAKGDVAAGPLVPARPGADAGRPRLRPDLVVGVDVRVPDARARDARAGPQPAGPDVPARRGPPDALRGRARRALGHLRVRRSTPATSSRPTSTRASACPASASSGA